MRMKSSLMLKQSHTKTSSRSVYRKRTAPKLLYLAKGLKYGYHHDDVMQISQNLAGGKEFHNSKIESQRSLYKGSGAFLFCA